MIVRTPSDAFNCGTMVRKFTNRSRRVRTPDKKFIVIASRSQKVRIEGPLETANFLGMSFVLGYYTVSLSQITHMNATVSRSTGQEIIIPSYRANSSTMAIVLAQPAILDDVPDLNGASASSDRNLSSVLVPI